MTALRLQEYTPEWRERWDRAVSESKNGNFLHLRDYMDYHAHRFKDRSVLILRGDRVAAVFPCNQEENRIVSHGGLTYAGLLYGRENHAAEVLDMVALLTRHYAGIGCRKMIYKAIPHVFHRLPSEEDLYALFRNNARLIRRDISSVISMGQHQGFAESRMGNLRKANRSGLQFQEGLFFDAYHALVANALGRFGVKPVHSVSELVHLKSRFNHQIRLFGAFRGEELLAGALVYDFGHIVHTQYLASSDQGRDTGALDFVIAHLIESVFADRQYLSFGISTEQGGHRLNEGLIFQKEGFGARGVVHDFYELDLTPVEA